MSCAFSSQSITSKPKRRSRCGEFRGCPVLSSHLAPGFAPQVGQCLANIRLASRFFIPRLCPREETERWSVLLTLGSLVIGKGGIGGVPTAILNPRMLRLAAQF